MKSRQGFRHWFTGWVVLVDERLQVFLFGLMGFGLITASIFLWHDMITGDNWVTVCGILFGSNAIGGGLSHIGKARQAPAPEAGTMRPIE